MDGSTGGCGDWSYQSSLDLFEMDDLYTPVEVASHLVLADLLWTSTTSSNFLYSPNGIDNSQGESDTNGTDIQTAPDRPSLDLLEPVIKPSTTLTPLERFLEEEGPWTVYSDTREMQGIYGDFNAQVISFFTELRMIWEDN